MSKRERMPIRMFRLGEEPTHGDVAALSPAERIGMMWQLVCDAWASRANRRVLNPDFRDTLSAFIAENVDFLVVGAYALSAHGIPRATAT
jgi:hypothetical protein